MGSGCVTLRRFKRAIVARLALATLIMTVGAALGFGAPAGALTLICAGNGNVAMVGTPTQTAVQQNLFIPQHIAACANAQGTLSYAGTSDDDAVLAATLRTNPLMGLDVPLSAVEKADMETDVTTLQGRAIGQINQIPALLEGYSVGYNLAGCTLTHPLELEGTVLAAIYSGAVTKWNDPSITLRNDSLKTCALRIQPVVRNDAATSTLIFKHYLSDFVPAFAALDQPDITVNTWPSTLSIACRGVGDSGVASCLGISGSIGYLRYQTASQRGIQSAAMENGNGDYVQPAATPATQAFPSNCPDAANSASLPAFAWLDWSTFSLTDAKAGYPICTFSYALVYSRMNSAYQNSSYGMSPAIVANVIDHLTTMFDQTVQAQLPSYGFAPLPESVRQYSANAVQAVGFS